jgi:hypothetical protein
MNDPDRRRKLIQLLHDVTADPDLLKNGFAGIAYIETFIDQLVIEPSDQTIACAVCGEAEWAETTEHSADCPVGKVLGRSLTRAQGDKFSVKTVVEPGRTAVDGPWRPTKEEAIKAFVESIDEREMNHLTLYDAFLAVRAQPLDASHQDSNGVYYVVASDGVHSELMAAGLSVGDVQ